MTYADRVRGAKDVKEALAAIAEGIDEILARPSPQDNFMEWGAEPEPETERALEIVEDDEDGVLIDIKPVSQEKRQRRGTFARTVLQLHQQDAFNTWDDKEAAIEAYAVGGPLWLYHGNRELVMQYSPDVRRVMVQDIEEDDPVTAQEVALDLLKVWDSEGPPARWGEAGAA